MSTYRRSVRAPLAQTAGASVHLTHHPLVRRKPPSAPLSRSREARLRLPVLDDARTHPVAVTGRCGSIARSLFDRGRPRLLPEGLVLAEATGRRLRAPRTRQGRRVEPPREHLRPHARHALPAVVCTSQGVPPTPAISSRSTPCRSVLGPGSGGPTSPPGRWSRAGTSWGAGPGRALARPTPSGPRFGSGGRCPGGPSRWTGGRLRGCLSGPRGLPGRGAAPVSAAHRGRCAVPADPAPGVRRMRR